MIIAVDGPVAAGKGTLARRLADHFGFAYLDTGRLYRAVAAKMLATGVNVADSAKALAIAEKLDLEDLAVAGLRDEAVGALASAIAVDQRVRRALLALQRCFATSPPNGADGAVIDGRDIGSVVCPDADIKLFVTAAPEIRAQRRHKELLERGEPSIYARVLDGLVERDRRDSAREISPLRPAEDAVVLDTSSLDSEAAFAAALKLIDARLQEKGR